MLVEDVYHFVESRLPEDTFLHTLRVALYTHSEDEEVVALCHDVVEDECATYDELRQIGVTDAQLDAIRLVTRLKGEQTYADYIDSIVASNNRVAMAVKTYDIYDHLQPNRVKNITKSHVLRYTKALTKIAQAQARDDT